ncbi:unnamed protein product [Peronospora belbahrii]|uniref:Anaphase-promoting complex subunit 4 WD40 domain-containing protein n=1 Tax=Peronospora belbahrii TaxID=622444 RepID=A0AAU9L1V3_9STRA|nr:unnamed protein product [Peronospora belbahrii]CAH0518583.1 unnamed protein product [Peronospora belbahrii]
MELQAWRTAVSYGAYLQSIHLKIVGSDRQDTFTSLSQESVLEKDENLHHTSPKTVETVSNGTHSFSQHLEASVDPATAQNGVKVMDKTECITVIPPYTSECFNHGEQMVLNAGGPVWAMDWLLSKTEAKETDVADDDTASKPKKTRRISVAGKTGAGKAFRCKENNKTETSGDGEKTAASNGTVDIEEDLKFEWRFLALATHPPCEVKDGKVVKSTPPDHYYDTQESARNLIQIWAVPVQRHIPASSGQSSRGKPAKRKLLKPRIVYAIDHESGVAWDLQWCPLVKKFPKACRHENILGILAVCFGDGSMKVFEIPAILEERLQPTLVNEAVCVAEKNILIVAGRVPRIMQLSVHWSPHKWNMLLTGGSDGSVSLWNIETAVRESKSLGIDHEQLEPIEPQRRFQDADTIGKQEAFDWGCGWAAIRAVAWSPFDEYIFASTGNDSVFKVWDVREPRVCLRSHRIRSTWGLALQWMDQTSIQISGDQGFVYMYDILSGSYQKLHFHPQIDTPIWDLQFARRGDVPLLISCCASGSIRAAPAKRLYRAPQNCVEICRLSGEKDSCIEKPFKSLTVSFEKHSVLGKGESGSQHTREFCERDAALHRLRLSSCSTGDYPCFLAAGGHAGLVILLEAQELLDTLVTKFFMAPSKKIGRPKKIFATVGGHHMPKKGPSKQTGGIAKGAISAGRKARTLGSFAKAKGMHTALNKYKKPPNTDKNKGKAKARSQIKRHQKNSFIHEDGQVEVDNSVEEESEFEEEDEEEDESDLSFMGGDSSDDVRVSVSDDDVEEEAEMRATNANPEEARLMKEYQLDLSEEDAYLLAVEMSQAGDAPAASALDTGKDTPSSASTPVVQEKLQQKCLSAKSSATVKRKARVPKTTMKATGRRRAPVTDSGKGEKRRGTASTKVAPIVAESNHDARTEANQKIEVQPDSSGEPESNTHLVVAPALTAEKKKPVAIDAQSSAVILKKEETKSKPNRAFAKKASTKSKKESSMLFKAINQAMALQALEYQMGMSEENALKQAVRLSEREANRRSSCGEQSKLHILSESTGGALPTSTRAKQTPATPCTRGPSETRQNMMKKAKEMARLGDTVAAFAEEDALHQRLQTPRRLQFSPVNGSERGDQTGMSTADSDGKISVAMPAPHGFDVVPSTAVSPPKESSPKISPGMKSPKTKSKMSVKFPSTKMETPKKAEAIVRLASEGAAASITLKGNKSAKRPKSVRTRAADSAEKCKKTMTVSRSGRRSSKGAAQGDVMSEEDALLLALKMSEIEY